MSQREIKPKYIVITRAPGQSDGYWGPFTTEGYADDAASFWNRAGIVDATIIELTPWTDQ